MPNKQKNFDAKLTREREEAWVGDAVLALFVREWILREKGKLMGELFVRFTSNEFLSSMGDPTSVEAEIGRVYTAGGLEAGFKHIEEEIMPTFIKQEKVREKRVLAGHFKK